MNIQIKESLESLIQIACSLFKQYNLYGCAYFTVSTFEDAEKIRHYDNKIDICILERKKTYNEELLKMMKDLDVFFFNHIEGMLLQNLLE